MLVIIDTEQETVTIRGATLFRDIVDWEEYLDYEVIIDNTPTQTLVEYLERMNNPSMT